MFGKANNNDTYEILKEFGEEYIKGWAKYIRYALIRFIEKRHASDNVRVDDYLLFQSIIDALVDIKRLKHFHGINYVNVEKLHAYMTSWILRRKPIQRLPSCSKKLIFVNELFAMEFLLNSLKHKLHDSRFYDQARASELAGHLFYHLKYRNTNPQTLELFLAGLNVSS